jgi:hypothetical protein
LFGSGHSELVEDLLEIVEKSLKGRVFERHPNLQTTYLICFGLMFGCCMSPVKTVEKQIGRLVRSPAIG